MTDSREAIDHHKRAAGYVVAQSLALVLAADWLLQRGAVPDEYVAALTKVYEGLSELRNGVLNGMVDVDPLLGKAAVMMAEALRAVAN